MRRHRVKLESARFIDQVWMRERLAQDSAIEEAVLAAHRETGEALPVLRERVDAYAEEIAPFFSMSAYYRIGAALARRIVDFAYELVLDADAFHEQSKDVPENAIRVYVINHRSNGDPVLLAYGLLRKIALSYAVGEWALVWPLHFLFRLFGSYFVRRGERDPLYHAVLERFVQLLAGHGGVTGFFIEGGLSRDGALRPAKAGLLTYLVNVRREQPDREIVFLPVGLNYDRVLEDRTLLRERNGPVPKPSLGWRLITLGAIAFWVPMLIVANVVKVATRSHRKFGYAAVAFGKPLKLSDWEGGNELHTLEGDVQKAAVQELAAELLTGRIARCVPATPVPLLCLALERCKNREIGAVQTEVRDLIAELRARGRPVALGSVFSEWKRRLGPEGNWEAELVVRLGVEALARRRVLLKEAGRLRVTPGEELILEYYAASIRHHLAAA
ncbi:MAG: 1-acyl-sn-glycerol-3-phosphate acyltransferase [Proteobacteria bacterium]|nr:1-acyl-sn-glycerol-3-phosphate acyltransferase [Pseudomonadota bacterium]